MTNATGNDVVTPDRVRGPKLIVAPAKALTDKRLSEADLRVLLALCSRANNETGKCWPSQQRIAEDGGVSRASVKRAVPRLEAFGWVSVERRVRANGTSDTTIYTVNDENLLVDVPQHAGDFDPADAAAERIDGLSVSPSPDDDVRAQSEPVPGHAEPVRGHSSDPGDGVTAMTPERLRGTNTAPPAAGAREDAEIDTANVRAHLDPRAHSAFDDFCSREMRRGSTAALLALVAEPLTGGPRFTWPEISAALIEMRGNAEFGDRLNAPLVRGVCRRLRGSSNASTVADLPALQRAQALWSLAAAEGLARPMTRESLIETCDRIGHDARVRALGLSSGQALFELVCAVRLNDFAGRSQRDERFIVRDLADRMRSLAVAS